MSLRGLAILALLLVAAVVVVWRVDRPASTDAPASESLGGLLPEQLDALGAVEVARAGESVRVERSGEGWKIVSPIEAEADPREVEELFRAVKNAKIRRVVEEKTSDRAAFGLAPAVATLRVARRDGTGSVALEIGRESPMGGSRYVGTAEGRVLLVEGLDAGVTDRDAESLRERRLLPVAETEVSRLTLGRANGALTVEREGDGWRLLAPVVDAADTPTTEGLLRTVAGLTLSKASAPPVPESGSPEITISIATKDGRTLRAELGPAASDASRWARRLDSSAGGVLEAGSVSDLTRDAGEYRDRRVMRAEPDEILAVRVTDAARSVRAWRKDRDSKWTVREGPGGSELAASESKVNELLDRLRWLRAERFDAGEPALDARVVELEGAAGSLGRIEIDREPYDAGKLLRVRSSWRPGALLAVPPERVGVLPQHAADLTD